MESFGSFKDKEIELLKKLNIEGVDNLIKELTLISNVYEYKRYCYSLLFNKFDYYDNLFKIVYAIHNKIMPLDEIMKVDIPPLSTIYSNNFFASLMLMIPTIYAIL